MVTNLSKNAASVSNQIKPGQGYAYDSFRTYDGPVDPISGNAQLYDQIGYASNPVNVAKNAASPTNQAKS